ncbi:MAG: HlyD family efflux transporter periplasmic adaptor subunit [Caulobacteraceae bacterium]|nr:HlyD family efflux transporter periplasmic adaptor subunit [Caulobacteraceae bacterium]
MNRVQTIALILALAAVGGGGYLYWSAHQPAPLPEGFASTNGRIEMQRFDVATKAPGRVLTVTPREGDSVAAGDLIATLDTDQIQARAQAASANLSAAQDAEARAQAEVQARQVALGLAQIETGRADRLVGDEAVSPADADRRRAQRDGAIAALAGARAADAQADAPKAAAAAQLAEVKSVLGDTRLFTPTAGRVEYRLVEPGAVVGAGSRIVTLLDPTDAYMTVFLPTADVVRLKMGAEARLRLDGPHAPILPARVSYIATDAQFTPRTVETTSERDKLMYRVKLAIDRSVLLAHPEAIHGGLTGVAYLRLDPNAPWPATLKVTVDHGR